MKLGMGTHEERNYGRVPTVQPSTINHQHSPSLQDGGSLHKHKNFKELLHTQIGNSQSQIESANPLGALIAYNPTNYIQLSRDMHEMSFNGAHL